MDCKMEEKTHSRINMIILKEKLKNKNLFNGSRLEPCQLGRVFRCLMVLPLFLLLIACRGGFSTQELDQKLKENTEKIDKKVQEMKDSSNVAESGSRGEQPGKVTLGGLIADQSIFEEIKLSLNIEPGKNFQGKAEELKDDFKVTFNPEIPKIDFEKNPLFQRDQLVNIGCLDSEAQDIAQSKKLEVVKIEKADFKNALEISAGFVMLCQDLKILDAEENSTLSEDSAYVKSQLKVNQESHLKISAKEILLKDLNLEMIGHQGGLEINTNFLGLVGVNKIKIIQSHRIHESSGGLQLKISVQSGIPVSDQGQLSIDSIGQSANSNGSTPAE